MLVNLYGNYGLIFQSLATGFNEAHAENNLKFSVVKKDDLDAKFTEAVKKAYNAKFLDDADAIIRFAEPVQAQPVQGQEEQGGQEEPPPEEGNGEQNQEEAPPSPPPENDNKEEQPPEENAGAEDDKKEQAQEEKPDEKSDDKKEGKNEDKPKDEKKDDDKKEKVNESENATNKSGAELKEQIIDTITRRLFQKGDNKVEVFDLQGYMDGYNVSFVKLSFGEGEKKNG